MNDKKRLLDIINLVEAGKSVIDVGTDHGLVPLYLAKNGISTDITATDISAPSLAKLENELDDELRKVIKTKVTDGFKGLDEKENTIAIIAGMGGNTIVEIINDSVNFAKSLDYMLLASNIATDTLRRYLISHGFVIERDFLTYENGKYYDILKVRVGDGQILSLAEIYYGFENISLKNPLLEKKLDIDYKKNLKFKENIVKFSKDKIGIERVEEKLQAINEVYDRWK